MTSEVTQIIWSDSYSVGIPEIDAQHKVLLGILNTLNHDVHGDLTEQNMQLLLGEKLDKLNEYAAFHFMTEEKLLQEYLSMDSSTAGHISQHRQYWVSINHFKKLARSDEMKILALLDFMNSWWIEHILKTDALMGKLVANGIN